MVFILRDWLASHLNLATAGEEYLLRVASRFGGPALDIVIPSSQFSRSDFHEIGEPGVAVPRCAPMGLNAFTTNPDRDAGLLDWLGIESHVLEAVELAMIAYMFLCPQARDGLKLLIGHSSPVLEGDA